MPDTTIQRIRKARGLTQSAVATTVGVHVVTVRKWESGRVTPRGDMLLKLAAALDIDPRLLLEAAA